MRQFTQDQLKELINAKDAPSISMYLPTHRCHPENLQDPIVYRNLVRSVEQSLAANYDTQDHQPLLDRFSALAHDTNFWNHRTDGLAILGSSAIFQMFDLQRPVKELAVVADSFHVKPLIRMMQATDRYQVLGLNRHQAKLYEGNRDALDEIDLADAVPKNIEEALGKELTEPHLTAASYGGAGGPGSAHGEPSMLHGHGGKKDEVDIDNERFFRAIDRAILEHHSRPSGLPLLLAALPEHHALFRKVSHNPFLLAEGVNYDPTSISAVRLCQEAWAAIEPQYLQKLERLNDDFQLAESKQLGSTDLSDIAQALIAGRVSKLMIESGRQMAGRVDSTTGMIEFGELDHPRVDDLLDDLAELTIKMGGEVIVVPAERSGTATGAAAIYRF